MQNKSITISLGVLLVALLLFVGLYFNQYSINQNLVSEDGAASELVKLQEENQKLRESRDRLSNDYSELLDLPYADLEQNQFVPYLAKEGDLVGGFYVTSEIKPFSEDNPSLPEPYGPSNFSIGFGGGDLWMDVDYEFVPAEEAFGGRDVVYFTNFPFTEVEDQIPHIWQDGEFVNILKQKNGGVYDDWVIDYFRNLPNKGRASILLGGIDYIVYPADIPVQALVLRQVSLID